MRFTKALLAAAIAASTMLALPAQAAREDENFDQFVKMCDTNKDGMVSKAELMKAVEKMFDKHDAGKKGELDRKQLEAFLKELMKGGG